MFIIAGSVIFAFECCTPKKSCIDIEKMQNFTVYHRASDGGIIAQLPTGGFGRLPASSQRGMGGMAPFFHQHVASENCFRAFAIAQHGEPEDINCSTIDGSCVPDYGEKRESKKESEEASYVRLCPDPAVLCYLSGSLPTARCLTVRRWLPLLLRINTVVPLGRVEDTARVLKKTSNGYLLRLETVGGFPAVALLPKSVHSSTQRADSNNVQDHDESDSNEHLKLSALTDGGVAVNSIISARCLFFSPDEGLVSCTIDSKAIQYGCNPFKIIPQPAAHFYHPGATTLAGGMLFTPCGLSVGEEIKVYVLLVCLTKSKDKDAPENPSWLVCTEYREPCGASCLIYTEVLKTAGTVPPAIGSTMNVLLVFVPSPQMAELAPFCIARARTDMGSVVPPVRLMIDSTQNGADVSFAWRRKSTKKNREEEDVEEEKSKQRLRSMQEVVDLAERKRDQTLPSDAAGFDRLLLSSPQDSFIWMQYILHWTGLQEIEQARNVAERALIRIPAHMDDERGNVWGTYMGLENKHGTAESLTAVFRRALANSPDQLKTHLALANIFDESGKNEQLQALCRTMTGKFKREPVVWKRLGIALVQDNKRDQLRRVFSDMSRVLNGTQQALVAEHIAIYEYKHGDVTHGRALFEGLVSKLPKRSDLWFAYSDQEMALLRRKSPEVSVSNLRTLFNRVSTQAFPPKAMQQALTRFLEFEQSHGTPQHVEAVKALAKNYVQSRIGESAVSSV